MDKRPRAVPRTGRQVSCESEVGSLLFVVVARVKLGVDREGSRGITHRVLTVTRSERSSFVLRNPR